MCRYRESLNNQIAEMKDYTLFNFFRSHANNFLDEAKKRVTNGFSSTSDSYSLAETNRFFFQKGNLANQKDFCYPKVCCKILGAKLIAPSKVVRG